MKTRILGHFCVLPIVLSMIAGASTTAWGQSSGQALPDPVVLEMLRFPDRPSIEVPSQEAFSEWPSQELSQRPYWLPWTRQAFQRAGLFSRPVLFVMTVNWSLPVRSMMSGPLSNPEVLEEVNRNYVSVMANADRRPDLKERYQTGDWPVIAFLLPNGAPMLSQANDMGVAQPITTSRADARTMKFLLTEGDKYWKKWPALLLDVGTEWSGRNDATEGTLGEPDELASDQMAAWLEGNADQSSGGFGIAPKFMVHGLSEYAAVRSARLKNELRRHSRVTLEKLVESPLYDSVEGGIHRLAAAPSWGSIQYEKRLKGNIGLVQQLLVELRQEDSPALRKALEQTANYMTTVLGRPEGGFYNAQAADPTSPDGGGYWTAETRDAERVPPVDRLVLAGPSVLAGAAVIRAGLLLENPELVAFGRRAIDTILDKAYTKGGGVTHVVDPQPDGRIYLTSQGDVALGLLDAFESLGDPRLLDAARDIVDFTLARLADEDRTALRDQITGSQQVGLLATPRYPLTPNVRMARAMIRLSLHGAGDSYRTAARRILSTWAGDLTPFGVQATEAALALEEYVRTPLMIQIDGSLDSPKTQDLRAAAVRSPWPWTLVRTGTTKGKAQAEFQWRDNSNKTASPTELLSQLASATGMDQR